MNEFYRLRLAAIILTQFLCQGIKAEALDSDSVFARIDRQRELFPQEKAYLMTDRDTYLGGDTIRFRTFIMDASTHVPVGASRYSYIELVSPSGKTEQRVKIRENDGIHSGYIVIPTSIAEGQYDLVAYTKFMQNMPTEYFPRKRVTLRNIRSIKDEITHRWDSIEGKLTLSYIDKTTGNSRPYKEMTLVSDGGKEFSPTGSPEKINVKIKPGDIRHGWVKVQYDEYAKFIHLDAHADSTAYSLSFYPEGGYLVDGTPCRVTFKGIGADGLSRNAEGIITDEEGVGIARYKSGHAGIGSTVITPRKGKRYFAVDRGGKTVELPAVSDRASVLHIHDRTADSIKITVAGVRADGMSLLVQQRGLPLAFTGLDGIDTVKFARSACRPGIVQLTLYDRGMRLLSERLIFIGNSASPQPSIITDRSSYKSRRQVKVSCSLSDNLMPGCNYAVSVTDRNSCGRPSPGGIWRHTLLQSDLRGHIESPDYYFSGAPDAAEALDDLMLTQGWTRYNIPETVNGNIALPSTDIETAMTIEGHVRSLWKNDGNKGATVSMMSPDTRYGAMAETDADGRFMFGGVELPEGSRIMLQAISPSGKAERNLTLEPEDYPAIEYPASPRDIEDEPISSAERMRAESNPELNSILLSEVTVTELRKPRQGETWYDLISRPRQYDTENEDYRHITTLEEAIRKIHGLRIKDDDGSIMFRGNRVAIFIDNVYLDLGYVSTGPLPIFNYENPPESKMNLGKDMTSGKGTRRNRWTLSHGQGVIGSSVNQLREIENVCPYSTIKTITFLIPGEAVALGTQATNGALMIRTKEAVDMPREHRDNGVREFIIDGYREPVEFYSPEYEPGSFADGSDLRATIYWNPCVMTDADGNSEFSFFTADSSPTVYDITVEGVSPGGVTFSACSTIDVD